MAERPPTCGRCGVYRHLHPTATCAKPRRSYWWDRHQLRRHVAAWLWIHATPTKARYRVGYWLTDHRGLDWCRVFDSIWYAEKWRDEPASPPCPKMLGYCHDYAGPWGCLCDFPLPWEAGPPRYGFCYCDPPEGWEPVEEQTWPALEAAARIAREVGNA